MEDTTTQQYAHECCDEGKGERSVVSISYFFFAGSSYFFSHVSVLVLLYGWVWYEMVTFCILVAPLPYSVKKPLFRFLSESPIIAKVAYGIKIAFMFVFLFRPALVSYD